MEGSPPSSPAGRGGIWFDVLLDPPSHLPLGNPDAVDRALTVEILSGRDVTFLTYDTNQAFRARGAGIKDVRKLDDDTSATSSSTQAPDRPVRAD